MLLFFEILVSSRERRNTISGESPTSKLSCGTTRSPLPIFYYIFELLAVSTYTCINIINFYITYIFLHKKCNCFEIYPCEMMLQYPTSLTSRAIFLSCGQGNVLCITFHAVPIDSHANAVIIYRF